MITVEYADRSWADAREYGFLSAKTSNNGVTLSNVEEGDLVFCHVAGKGFLGVGTCVSKAVPFLNFVTTTGRALLDEPWHDESAKSLLDYESELTIGIEWLKAVDDAEDGYWEKGLKALPMPVYELKDKTTYELVLLHFGVELTGKEGD